LVFTSSEKSTDSIGGKGTERERERERERESERARERKEIIGELRKLNNVELHKLYYLLEW
jgi:hypothetical protein